MHWPRVWGPDFIAAGQHFLASTSTFTADPRRGPRCGVDVQHRCHKLHRFESRRMGTSGNVTLLVGKGRWYYPRDRGLDFSYDSRT